MSKRFGDVVILDRFNHPPKFGDRGRQRLRQVDAACSLTGIERPDSGVIDIGAKPFASAITASRDRIRRLDEAIDVVTAIAEQVELATGGG